MELAFLYASWSKDPSRKVGAVIARGKKQVSQGYNGFPPGVEDTDERLVDRPMKLQLVVHAERNAIYNASGKDLHGTTLYSTLFPCVECAKSIVSVGIKNVIYKDELTLTVGSNFNPDTARLIFEEAGINVKQLKDET